VREQLSQFKCFDGEIMTYTNGKPDDFNTVQSKIMSHDGEPDYKFLVFDSFHDPDLPFIQRYDAAVKFVEDFHLKTIQVVPHTLIGSVEDFIAFADHQLAADFEGAMYRSIDGLYKSGRSTLRQGWLVKWKNFQDAEGTVVDFIEQLHNENEATTDKLGLTERSSKQENMVGKNTLGALVLNTQWGTLRVGTGFDDLLRKRIWQNRDNYMGKIVTFKYQPHGAKNLPRFPVFKAFRED
jgi:DNA ligase-1